MSTLLETIGDTMMRLGPGTRDRMRDIVAELAGLNLGAEDRLSVLATALAAVASLHHAPHMPVYIEAVRAWSLEISVGLAPSPLRLSSLSGDGPVEDGAEILIAGLDSLLDGIAGEAVTLQDRLVLELALFSQLLGQHDASAVHLTLRAVSEAVADDDYRPGRAVRVPVEEMALPLDRDACLESVAPRGVA
jgi:hypothetical protein